MGQETDSILPEQIQTDLRWDNILPEQIQTAMRWDSIHPEQIQTATAELLILEGYSEETWRVQHLSGSALCPGYWRATVKKQGR